MRFDEVFEVFAESIAVPVVVADPDGIVLVANTPARALFTSILGCTEEQFLATPSRAQPWTILDEDGHVLEGDEQPGARARERGEPVRERVLGFVVGETPPRWLVQSSVPFARTDEPGRFDVVSTFVDITARRELETQLHHRATHDALTGTANRLLFEERLVAAAKRADQDGRPVTVLVIDVDDFKNCNDRYGHAGGDEVLRALTTHLHGLVRTGDTVARLGGDEFGIVLEGAGVDRATGLATDLLAMLREPIAVDDDVLAPVSVSIGIASWEPGAAPGDLQLAADEAVFAAKHAGKGSYVVHDPTLVRSRAPHIDVDAGDAHAWARYVGDLRAEIGRRKDEGRLPEGSAAPDSVYRTLLELLLRIERLPTAGPARLELPRHRDLAVFVFHHASVDRWVATLRERGILVLAPDPAAERFWAAVRAEVEPAHTPAPGQEM